MIPREYHRAGFRYVFNARYFNAAEEGFRYQATKRDKKSLLHSAPQQNVAEDSLLHSEPGLLRATWGALEDPDSDARVDQAGASLPAQAAPEPNLETAILLSFRDEVDYLDMPAICNIEFAWHSPGKELRH